MTQHSQTQRNDAEIPSHRSASASVPSRPRPSIGGLDESDFKLAFRNHAAGVAVVTADPGDGPVGLTVASVSSVSAVPPLFVFSVSAHVSSAPALRSADTVIVHLLGSSQLGLARLCSTSGIDRFADTSIWDRLVTGEPYFPSAHAWIRGTVINRMEAGGSTVFAVHALQAKLPHETDVDESPLVYHNRSWHELGDRSRIDS